MTILILFLAPWISMVLLVLAACHGASVGEAQLRVPQNPRHDRFSRRDRMDVAGCRPPFR
jgi:hypothetical protein